MVKAALVAAAVWISVVAPRAPEHEPEVEPEHEPELELEPAPASAGECTPAEKCCKICDEGRACGKTCIAKNKTCHVGRGCACNASEVCSFN